LVVIEGILTVLILIAVGVGFFAFMDFVRVHSMHYELDDAGLAFVGVLWRPKPIPYWQIESVRLVSWADFLQDAFFDLFRVKGLLEGFNTRWYTTRTLCRTLVVVRHRDGREFILTPDDPITFVRTVTERIAGTAPPKMLVTEGGAGTLFEQDATSRKSIR